MIKTLMTLMAFQYLNVPYKWAGNSYDGLDCSGFVLKVLHDIGVTLPDMTAQGIYNYCLKQEDAYSSKACDSLLFFGKNDKNITHVAISLGEIDGKYYLIEAGGSGRESLHMSLEDLARIDARVRIKPITNRKDFIAGIYLPYGRNL